MKSSFGTVDVLVAGGGMAGAISRPRATGDGDQMAMSSFRVMTTCAQMGLAAGLAAAHCAAEHCAPLDLNVTALQAALENAGQSLRLTEYG